MTRLTALAFLCFALCVLEIFIGGARLAYASVAGGLVGLAAITAILPGWRTTGRPNKAAVWAAVLFAVYVIARNRFSDVEYIGRLHFVIVASSLAVYLLFAFVLTRPTDRKFFFGFIIGLTVLQLVPAAVQFFGQDGWMPLPFAQRRHDSWRSSGFFISPNNFAGFVEMGGLLAAALALLGRTGRIWRAGLLLVALGCGAAVIASGSRGGYIGSASGVFALAVLSLSVWTRSVGKGKRKMLPAALVAGLIIALFGAWLMVSFDPVLSDRVQEVSNPTDARPLLWSSALQQFKLSPLLGTGGFSFLYYGRMFRDPSVQGDPIHVHNDYLQLLADYGMAGAVLFAAVLFFHALSGLRTFAHLRLEVAAIGGRSDRLAVQAGCLAVMVAYLAHSVVEFNVQLPLNAMVIAAVLASLANAGAPGGTKAASEVPAGSEVAVHTALALTGAMLIGAAWRFVPGEYFVERTRYALREKNLLESLDWARRGLAVAGDNPELCYQAGEAALQSSFTETPQRQKLRIEAAGHFANGLRSFPYDSRLALKLAHAQAAAGDYWSASESLVYAEQLDPNSALVPAFRGIVEYWGGDAVLAKDAFEQALQGGGEGAVIAREGLQLLKEQPEVRKQEDGGFIPPMPPGLRAEAERSATKEGSKSGEPTTERFRGQSAAEDQTLETEDSAP